MDQPKFKFGDKVVIKATGKVFVISHMRLVFKDMGVQYWGDGWSHSSSVYTESELELYQEPQKKKLYAYRVPGRSFEVKLFAIELDEHDAKIRAINRLPEYDIEYLETHKDKVCEL